MISIEKSVLRKLVEHHTWSAGSNVRLTSEIIYSKKATSTMDVSHVQFGRKNKVIAKRFPNRMKLTYPQ